MSTKSTALATKDQAPAAQDPATPLRRVSVIERIAARFSVDPAKMMEALKATAFRQRPAKDGKQPIVVTNEHMMMLLVIADQYHLNPFTREIYAFPQEGGIVPIISIDGWIRIINEHPMLESIEFNLPPLGTAQDDYFTECVITRKDRKKPIAVTEWLKECYRDTQPWNDMPKRMLRHKALIQCARVAFGFGGMFDPDEGERIYAAAIDVTPRAGKPEVKPPQAKVTQEPAKPERQLITVDQSTMIKDALADGEIDLSLFLAQFEIGAISELDAGAYDNALNWIDAKARGQ